ncbi:hypothetical protein D0504_05385 [Weissella confusa]|uniref:hypothetical protein n=1 Tax=Weissella confusa TaxID=1583 RepID=UPI0021C1CDC1|nr:hypothetical protein [Weissella confusa]MCT8393167.1 hypothetical protein [Weissella confusa]
MKDDVIECPWCGQESKVTDIWEYDGSETCEWQCEHCHEVFYFDVSIHYVYELENARKEEQEEN